MTTAARRNVQMSGRVWVRSQERRIPMVPLGRTGGLGHHEKWESTTGVSRTGSDG